jgi:hypothetical protein
MILVESSVPSAALGAEIGVLPELAGRVSGINEYTIHGGRT